MSHITKQERSGLEELFKVIEKHRYESRWKVFGRLMKVAHRQQKRFMMRSFKALKS